MSKTEPEKPRLQALAILARNLRRHREQRDLSLDELSRLTGIAVKRLTALEEGRGDTRIDSLDRLASALAIPLYALFADRSD